MKYLLLLMAILPCTLLATPPNRLRNQKDNVVRLSCEVDSTPFATNSLILGHNMSATDWFGLEGNYGSLFYCAMENRIDTTWKPWLEAFPLRMVRLHWGNEVNWQGTVGPLADRKNENSTIKTRQYATTAGLDEFLREFHRLPDPPEISLIASPFRPAQELADLVAYCNASTGPMAEERARNGHPEPYGVKYWELGNEIDFHNRSDLDIMRKDTAEELTGKITVDDYIGLAIPRIAAMRQVDPGIKIYAHAKTSPWFNSDPDWPRWHQEIIRQLGGDIDGIVIHPYYDGYTVPTVLESIDRVIEDIKTMAPSGRHLDVWVNEHARWVDPNMPIERPQTTSLQGAISTADFLLKLIERPEVHAANYWNLGARDMWRVVAVDWDSKSHKAGELKYGTTMFYLYQLFNEALLPEAFKIKIDHGGYDKHPGKYNYSVSMLAMKDARSGAMSIIAVNRSPETSFSAQMDLSVPVPSEPIFLHITGDYLKSINSVQNPSNLKLNATPWGNINIDKGKVELLIPARSICAWVWNRDKPKHE